MTKLRRVGFFNETPHAEPADPSLAALRAPTAAANESLLVGYLEAGEVYIATPELAVDVLDGQTRIGPASYLTDGRYRWPADAAYYEPVRVRYGAWSGGCHSSVSLDPASTWWFYPGDVRPPAQSDNPREKSSRP